MSKERIQIRDKAQEELQELTLQELATRLRAIEVEVFGADKGPLPNEDE